MKQQKLHHEAKANSTVLIEGLEGRRLMSSGAMGSPTAESTGAVDEAMHHGAIAMTLRSESAGISAGGKLNAPEGSAFSTPLVAKEAKATSALFSARLIPSPATDNVLIAAMGERSVAPSAAAGRSNASNQGTRSLGVSSAHSFAGRPPRREQNRTVSSSRGRVLLVEDDASTRRALSMILQQQGWAVSTAGTVAEGIRKLATRPDHVIVDLMLPDGDGAELLEHANASQLHPHVTVTTGVADSKHLDRVRRLGAQAVFIKPVNVPDLLKQLTN